MKRSWIFNILAFSGALLFLIACSTQPSVTTSSKNDKKIRSLESELRKRQIEIDDLRERNSVLEQRLARARHSTVPVEAIVPAVPVPAVIPKPQLEQPAAALTPSTPTTTLPPRLSKVKVEEDPKSSEDVQQTGEQRLYSKVLESYRGHKEVELQKAAQILLKTYPDSVYADNALYLAGLLAFETNDWTHSLAYMDRVLREYPNGNKSVSALFAKAMIAKHGRNFEEAKAILQSVRKLYPGSPEAMRAGTEEKLIEIAANTAKGREG